MIRKIVNALTVAAIALCPVLWAQEEQAKEGEGEGGGLERVSRIDIDGRELVPLQPGKISAGKIANATWMSDEDNAYYLTLQFPSSTFQWERIEFSFMPMADGEVSIMLKGPWKRVDDKQVELWSLFDSMQIKGGKIRNGDFESTKDDGKPYAWKISGSEESPAVHVDDGSVAQDGRRCAKTWHNGTMTQRIAVREGRQVYIRVWHQAVTAE